MAFLEQKGQLAKLLASENLIINYDATAQTASFNTAARILTMPLLQTESEHIFNLMMAHEASHAINTPVDWVERVDDEIPFDIVNVCEDVRIERMIQDKFPGLRRDFSRGYDELHQKDFFEVASRNVNEMSFCDRLNLYFKGGARMMIQFSEDELVFVHRLEKVETFDEVVQIAADITRFVKATPDPDPQPEQVEVEDGRETEAKDGERETTKPTNDSSESEESEYKTPEIDETKSETQEAFDKNLLSLNNHNDRAKVEYVKAPHAPLKVFPLEFLREDFSTNLHQLTANGQIYKIQPSREDFDNFMSSIKRDVNFMVQQFEMKKSADAYARSSIHKTGVLDTNNLHNYKLTDDLFLRQTLTPQGKNHGMIMLLDWSGSMQDKCLATIKQILVLCQFCRKVSIPFDVYTFTANSYGATEGSEDDETLADEVVVEGIRVTHVLSSSVKRYHIEEDMFNLYSQGIFNSGNYMYGNHSNALSMGGTPLNNVLFMVPAMVQQMKERTRAQKISFVCVTDGESTPLFKYERCLTWTGKEEWAPRMTRDHKNLFLRDGCKVYQLDQGMQQTGSIVRWLREKMPEVTFTHIYLGGPTSSARYIREITGYTTHMNDSEFRRHGSTVVKTNWWPLVALMNPNSFTNPSDELQVDNGATKGKIRQALKKMLKSKQQSKTVLSQLVTQFS